MLSIKAKRFAAASLASVLAFSLVAPTFVTSAMAAPLPVATTLASDHSLAAGGLPLTDVRYRRYGYRHRHGGAFAGGALALGVLGLGIAAIAAQERADRRRERANAYYYNPGYYNDGYYGGYAPAYVPAPPPALFSR